MYMQQFPLIQLSYYDYQVDRHIYIKEEALVSQEHRL